MDDNFMHVIRAGQSVGDFFAGCGVTAQFAGYTPQAALLLAGSAIAILAPRCWDAWQYGRRAQTRAKLQDWTDESDFLERRAEEMAQLKVDLKQAREELAHAKGEMLEADRRAEALNAKLAKFASACPYAANRNAQCHPTNGRGLIQTPDPDRKP